MYMYGVPDNYQYEGFYRGMIRMNGYTLNYKGLHWALWVPSTDPLFHASIGRSRDE